MRLILLAILCSAVGSCGTTRRTVAQTPIDWERQARVIATGRDADMLVRASEAINVLYVSRAEEGSDANFAASHDQGETFSKILRINPVPGQVRSHGENAPQLRLGKGQEAFVAFESEGDLWLARSVDFGRSFLAPVRIDDDQTQAHQSFFTMEVSPKGAVWVAWIDFRDHKSDPPGTASLYIAASTDRGASFSKNVKVAGGICPCCRPAIAFDSDKIYIAWRHVFERKSRDMAISVSRDAGITWTSPVRVAEDNWSLEGCPHSGPALGVLSGTVVAVWYTGAGDSARLRMGWSTDEGRTFKVRDVHGSLEDANHPHLTVANEEAWLIFQARAPGRDETWEATRAWLLRVTANGAVSPPTPLPSAGGSVSYPRVTLGTAGRAYAVWTESDAKGSRVVLARGRKGGGGRSED